MPHFSKLALTRWMALALLLLALPATAVPGPVAPVELSLNNVAPLTMPPVDHDAMLAEDERNQGPGVALRFAAPMDVAWTPETHGTWEPLSDAEWVWRLRVRSPGAFSLNFGFGEYFMPEGGRLLVYPTADASRILGPYEARHNRDHGQLWTPILPTDDAVIEVRVPTTARDDLRLELTRVSHAYRDLEAPEKAGNCNIDVVCPESAGWERQIRSVARITVGGFGVCTGFMVNNTSFDLTPYFMTADHCQIGTPIRPAASVVSYWNYESPECRTPGTIENGTRFDGALDQTVSGSTLLATGSTSDYTLLLLDESPPADFNVFWAGWDARDVDPDGAVAIHHPQTHAKRISFEDDPLTTTSYLQDAAPGNATHLRVDDWDLGTTEGGSSGSPLFNLAGQVVGQLHGGFAACGNDLPDWYGRMSVTLPNVAQWLDPSGSGDLTINGTDATDQNDVLAGCDTVVTPAPCVEDEDTFCLLNNRFEIQVTFRRFGSEEIEQGKTVNEVTADDSGLFYFFGEDNWEMLVKMVDACGTANGANNHFWLFSAGTTNLEYTLSVTDTQLGCQREFFNPLGQAAQAVIDTRAFATCL